MFYFTITRSNLITHIHTHTFAHTKKKEDRNNKIFLVKEYPSYNNVESVKK